MKYIIRHTFKPTIIVPHFALRNNGKSSLDFMLNEGERVVVTSDGVECRALNVEEKHLCELESDIKSIYGMDTWNWLKRWYNIDSGLCHLCMVKMDLEKL